MTWKQIDWEDIVQAKARIAKYVGATPLVRAHRLSARLGQDVYFKCENLQVTGAFKARGATNFVLSLVADANKAGEPLPAGVITGSSGNHGQAVAFAAKQVGLPCVVVVPEDVVAVKEAAIRSYGAEVVRCGRTSSERIERAETIAAERGLVFVPPYNHPLIVAGQGTAGLELAEQLPAVRQVFVPVGGGGLVSGVATAVRSAAPDAQVYGVEPELGNDAYLSLKAGRIVDIGVTTTVADGLRTNQPGSYTFAIMQERVDGIVLVSESSILGAMRDVGADKLIVEPSGATSVAGLIRAAEEGWLTGPAVCVLSGGNVAPEILVETLV